MIILKKFIKFLDLNNLKGEFTSGKFLKNIKKFDCVVGSRYIKGGRNDLKGFRYLISKFGNIFIKKMLNINLSEYTTSYRCFNLIKLKKFNLNKVKAKGYSFCI